MISDYFSQIVLVLYLIILSLAVTRIVTHLAELIRNRDKINFYWIHFVWIFILFIFLLQFAEHAWGFRCAKNWNNLHVIAILINPLLAFLAVEVLAPEIEKERRTNLKEFYFGVSKPFFTIMAIMPIANYLTDSFLTERWALGIFEIFSVAFFLLFVPLALNKSKTLHGIFSVLILVIFFSFSVVYSSNYADPETRERVQLCTAADKQ